MIIYSSLQTDIPAFYMDWLIERLKSGYVDIKQMKGNGVDRYNFKTNKIDKIHLYTRDPYQLLKKLPEFKQLGYSFDTTVFLTFYDKYYEPKIKEKNTIFNYIRKLSNLEGKKNVSLGYGPVFYTNNNDENWHLHQFSFLCKILKTSVSNVCIDFNINNYCQESEQYNATMLSPSQQKEILAKFEEIAKENGLTISTKKTTLNLEENELDIGLPNTCMSACKYCKYINNEKAIPTMYSLHNMHSSTLIGTINDTYKISNIKIQEERKEEIKKESSSGEQLSFF